MTYRPHLVLQFGGRLFNTEIWSCSLRMILGDPATTMISEAAMQTWAEENVADVADDVRAWFLRSDSLISNAARLDFVKLNTVDENGRYWSQEETVQFEWLAGDAPTGTVVAGEPQNTVCVSLLTDAARGRASRGRFYPPTGNFTPTAGTGKISGTLTQQMADSALLLLNDLANEPGVDLQSPRVVVASDLGSPGPMRNVTMLAVGDVIDTQRRRRNNLIEAYSNSAAVTIV